MANTRMAQPASGTSNVMPDGQWIGTRIVFAVPVEGPWCEYEGYRFRAPFLCMCCGVETSVQQWAFSRTCGKCDTGICQSWHDRYKPEYAHENPAWKMPFGTSRADSMAAFAAHATYDRAPTTEVRDA